MPSSVLRQAFLIPSPSLTEKELKDQTGRVFIVTGGYSGIGFQLCEILYQHGGTIYIAGRSESKAQEAIQSIKAKYQESSGRLEFLALDLADLPTIKKSADRFLSLESRLDVLMNNAGVMLPPAGSKTVQVRHQGYELQMGTNCLGPFLFTRFLTPILQKTAASSPPGTVRVTWAASLTVDFGAPPGGVTWTSTGAPQVHKGQDKNYAQSKAGNIYLSAQMAAKHRKDGIVSVAWNPGNLRTDLQRHLPGPVWLIFYMFCHPSINGAYTELYAGWSDDIKLENSGAYVIPWGRLGESRADIVKGCAEKSDGTESLAVKFWNWCESETAQYFSE